MKPILLLLFPALLLGGCDRAQANQQTLITNDCGVTWELIKPGESVPKRIGPCQYKTTLPDYPMQGEARFKTSFKDRVLASVEVSYEYIIEDGVVFLGEAKYLGKQNSGPDDETNSASKYESAENGVIEKRIRESATALLLVEDIVEFSQAEFEDKLLAAANELLKDKGVQLNFISFVPIPEEQTRLAIDTLTAMRIYQTRGLEDLGKGMAVARAGATKIEVTTGTATDNAQK
jgi:hypothetical protein